MRYSKPSNTFVTTTLKKLLLMVLAMLVVSCGEKEQHEEQEKSESNPKEEPKKLPPLPKTVTAEFIMGLWAKPHNGTEIMEELKDYALKPGVWKYVRNIGPRKGELKERRESSMANKVVDRRFIVRQFTFDEGVAYGVVTYDRAVEGYRWWELMPDGLINEISGKLYRRNLLEWTSVVGADKDVQITKRETVTEKELWEATVEFKKGGELMAYAEDEATWLRKLEPPEKTREEKYISDSRRPSFQTRITEPDLEIWKGADKSYKERRAKDLNQSERKLVGRFEGGNRELKWEIHRHKDGTFELVMLQKVDGVMVSDYTRGIWGVDGERYFLVDLESLNRKPGGEPERFWEKVRKITKDRFETTSEGEDGKELVSPENRVEEFSIPLWKKITDE
jgi:hypothetical protein